MSEAPLDDLIINARSPQGACVMLSNALQARIDQYPSGPILSHTVRQLHGRTKSTLAQNRQLID